MTTSTPVPFSPEYPQTGLVEDLLVFCSRGAFVIVGELLERLGVEPNPRTYDTFLASGPLTSDTIVAALTTPNPRGLHPVTFAACFHAALMLSEAKPGTDSAGRNHGKVVLTLLSVGCTGPLCHLLLSGIVEGCVEVPPSGRTDDVNLVYLTVAGLICDAGGRLPSGVRWAIAKVVADWDRVDMYNKWAKLLPTPYGYSALKGAPESHHAVPRLETVMVLETTKASVALPASAEIMYTVVNAFRHAANFADAVRVRVLLGL